MGCQLMNELDLITYVLVGLILASTVIEGKRTRYRFAIFFISVCIYVGIIAVGFSNWIFNDSKFGFGIAAMALFAVLAGKLRILIYRVRSVILSKNLVEGVSTGNRFLFVLPDNAEFSDEIVRTLNKKFSGTNSLFITDVGIDFDGNTKTKIAGCHQLKNGYVLLCEGQRNARTWVKFVENDEAESAIAVNFSFLPDTDEEP